MHIEQVTAGAFGPLRAETLQLAEGLTVVVGDNESGKSSWHAAIFAALCGTRRGRGQPRVDDRRFAHLHRPWTGSEWKASARLTLDGGRRVEIRQDLAGKVDCQAMDLDLGRDLSAEIMFDGSPDGSRWLGLDRDNFLATACVEQAQMLRVLQDPGGLQEHLQRAAATAGTDATAAAALERLDDYSREHVGTLRSNSTKPLQRAINAQAAADRQLSRAIDDHEKYLSRIEQLEQLRAEADRKSEIVRVYEAVDACAAADKLTHQSHRAAELYAVYGDTPPCSIADDDAVGLQVAAALESWRTRPAANPPVERSSAELEAEIDLLPAPPQGDTEPDQAVTAAHAELIRTEAQIEQHAKSRALPGPPVPRVDAPDAELLDLARALETPSVPAAGQHAAAAGTQSPWLPAAAGLVLAVVGIALIAVAVVVGVAVLIVGLVAGAVGWIRRGGGRGTSGAEETEYAAAAVPVVLARCAELGIQPDPAVLRAIPTQRDRASALERQEARWTQQWSALTYSAAATTAHLTQALVSRGVELPGPERDQVAASYDRYVAACRERRATAQRASRRDDLVAHLTAVRAAESRASADDQERLRAGAQLLSVATTVGINATTPAGAVQPLHHWMEQRSAALGEMSQATQKWAELTSILAGHSLTELEQAAAAAQARADRLADGIDPDFLARVEPTSSIDHLPALRKDASEAASLAASAQGELHLYAKTIISVAEAEEGLQQAAVELARVRQLDSTLSLARKFLDQAQESVHRSIAPVLAATLRSRLPRLTEGRYTDAVLNPETLAVKVLESSGSWRDADQLSFGTAEQVYLLLRIALADHLTRGFDTCPLLLDDITVHADALRTRRILDLLLEVAASRQVVLFTQEEQVAGWAQENLYGPRHAVVRLPQEPAA